MRRSDLRLGVSGLGGVESKLVLERKKILATALLAILIVGVALAAAPVVQAQGCVMCYTSTSAAGQRGERALRQAILVLMIPVLCLFIGILLFAWRRSYTLSAHVSESPLPPAPAPKTELRISWSPRTR
jgi:hypothetical protein